MTGRHRLLKRQIERYLGAPASPAPGFEAFLDVIDAAYHEFDLDHELLERSIELSSQELLQANGNMRAIFQALPDIFFRIDPDGRILDCRGGGTADLIRPRHELLGRRIQDVPDVAAREAILEALTRVHHERDVTIEYGLTRESGTNHYQARFTSVANGQCVIIIQNITESWLSAEILNRQRQYLRQIVDLNPSFIFAKDAEGRYRLVNQAVAEAFGLPVEQILGRTDAVLHSDAREIEHFRRGDLHVIQTGEDRFDPEAMILDAAGTPRFFQTIKRAIASPDGMETHVLGVATDITERRQAEDRLRRRSERLLLFQEALHDLALLDHSNVSESLRRVTETACRVVDVRRASVWLHDPGETTIACECLRDGGAFAETSGPTLRVDSYPLFFSALQENRMISADNALTDPRVSEFLEGHLVPHGIISRLDVVVRLNGRVAGVLCLEHVGPPRSWTPEEQQFAASAADFVSMALAAARRRQLEDQLRQSQKMEAIGHLSGGIAHDFNNLLSVILGYTQIMLQKAGPDDAARGYAGEIQQAAERAAALTRQLLAFSRKQVVNPGPLRVGDVVRRIEPMLKRLIGEHISLVTSLPDEDAWVLADCGQIEQVLLNLVVNARDAMTSGGTVTIAVSDTEADPARRSGSSGGRCVDLVVSDSGAGIPEADLPRIFEPFFTTKEAGKGTGLGLSTAYGIVQQHGGQIDVTSQVGVGTRISVMLPRIEGPAVVPATLDAPISPSRGSEVILLAEDEEQLRTLIGKVLMSRGFTVLSAPDGPSALALSQRYPGRIHALLTDVVMPKMNGRQLYEKLRARRPKIRVLYMSGYTDGILSSNGTLEPGTTLLHKPLSPDSVAQKLREILDAPVTDSNRSRELAA